MLERLEEIYQDIKKSFEEDEKSILLDCILDIIHAYQKKEGISEVEGNLKMRVPL